MGGLDAGRRTLKSLWVATTWCLVGLTGRAAGVFHHPCGFDIDTDTDEPLFVFLLLDKTASSSLRDAFLHHIPEEYVSILGYGAGCVRKPRHPLVVSRWGMHGNFSTCELVAPRPCHYFTIVRNPVARAVSAFNYFCLGCAENGRQCGYEDPKFLTCPDMSISQYASVFQNVYTKVFAHPYEWMYNEYVSDEDDFIAAQKWIDETKPLVLFTEDMFEGQPLRKIGDMLNRDVIRNMPELPHSNTHEHALRPSPDLVKRLEGEYFHWDTKLYEWLRTEYVQPDISQLPKPKSWSEVFSSLDDEKK